MAPTLQTRMTEIGSKARDAEETLAVPWQNSRRNLPVINLSLDNVLLNHRSHRIRAQIESHELAWVIEEDPESEHAQRLIEEILTETSGFDDLKESLSESGQRDTGIITHAGVLINANTRAVALRQLSEQYIRVAVLPNSATPQEIVELEARLQLDRDYKQEYTLANELLFIKEQIDAGTEIDDLAILLGKATSRNRKQLEKGRSEIEKSLRILQHIREVQEASRNTIPLTFFDPHESALIEADSRFVAFQGNDPDQAERVRNGRIAGVLVGVTYRNLRNWESDEFVTDYVEPQFDSEGDLLALLTTDSEVNGSSDLGGLDVFDDEDSESKFEVDPNKLLRVVARHYRDDENSVIAGELTQGQLYEECRDLISQAAEERAQDRRDEKRQHTPIRLVRDARKKLLGAQKAFERAAQESEFEFGKFRYELRQVRKELDTLSESSEFGG